MTVMVRRTETSYNHFHQSPEMIDGTTIHEVVPP